MLAQIEEIAKLRRRLERCLHAEVLAELAWRVEDFDRVSGTQGFWELPDAPENARAAEHARELVDGVVALSEELEAIEELVREAYHMRAFELSEDIDERVAEMDPRLSEVFLELVRTLHDRPDEVVLFLPATDPEDPWRAQLVSWYRQLAAQRGWRMSMRRALARVERPDEAEVRALLTGEDGLHRRISEDGNAVVEVYLLSEDQTDWPMPSDFEGERPLRPEARVWNFRTSEISMLGLSGLELDIEDPWPVIWPYIEDLAWEMAGAEWW